MLLLPGLLGPLFLPRPLLLLNALRQRLLRSLLLRLAFLRPLLLPRLLCTLRRLLGGLSMLLSLRPRLILRLARLWPLLSLGGRRRLLFPAFPLLALLLFGLALPFILVVLRVRGDARSEKQEQGGGAGGSNGFHDNRLL